MLSLDSTPLDDVIADLLVARPCDEVLVDAWVAAALPLASDPEGSPPMSLSHTSPTPCPCTFLYCPPTPHPHTVHTLALRSQPH